MKMSMREWQLARFSDRGSRDERVCAESGLFDSDWYLKKNPNVAASGINPLTHYIRTGAAEGLAPNPLFDSDWYLKENPDVAASGINPLVHYVRWGAAEGLNPNRLFDSDWYLKQNPDIAAAGMNPLHHYIRWGAAKGLDPSPLFNTLWYLEQNPDVATAGVNPLAHYIHWGAVEGREPVSPIPRLFAKLAIKPRLCAAELERILETYSSPPDIAPEKARADNHSQVGVSWAEHFMFNSVERYTCGDLQAALRLCKYAVQILPYEDDPLSLYSHIFTKCNRSAIEVFSQAYTGASLLVIHLSHHHGIPQAERSCRSFYDADGKIANLTVVGKAGQSEDIFSFDRARSILFVPAEDSYEALPRKIAKALLFLGHCPVDLSIVKVDDDASCEDLRKLKQLADEVLCRHLYGGRINPRTTPVTCPFWHFGKCTDPEINFTPDSLMSTSAYAGGQGYWMNATAVSAMSKISLIHGRYFDIEYFEDRAIGTALAQYGIRPHHYDLVAAGVLRDLGQPPGAKNRPVRLRSSRARR